MALDRHISKAKYDKLSKELQAEYEADDEGEGFTLNAVGFEDADELRRGRDREKADRRKAQKELKEAQDRIAELEGETTRESGDITKIEAGWKEKLATLETESSAKLSAKDKFIRKSLITAAAESMAGKISTTPKLLSKAIAERLDVDFEGDEPALVVLGSDGKPDTKLTIDKLEKEFVDNKEFASIIIGSKASGGGAPRKGPDQRPGGAVASETQTTVPLAKQDPKSLVASLKDRQQQRTEAK